MSDTIEISAKHGTILVDSADYGLIKDHVWWSFANRQTCYVMTRIDGQPLYMHRLIMAAQPSQIIDHINRNGLDNRRENLRFCTRTQNQTNGTSRGGSSKYKGVCLHKATNKWQAALKHNGKQTHLGLFESEEEAAKAYNIAAAQVHGEFFRGNDV